MNERFEQMMLEATKDMPQGYYVPGEYFQKFAELIVRECADTIENRTPGQMGKEGEGWTNGYDDGLKTSAFLIKKHFGVEE